MKIENVTMQSIAEERAHLRASNLALIAALKDLLAWSNLGESSRDYILKEAALAAISEAEKLNPDKTTHNAVNDLECGIKYKLETEQTFEMNLEDAVPAIFATSDAAMAAGGTGILLKAWLDDEIFAPCDRVRVTVKLLKRGI